MFANDVYKILREIPQGRVVTYGQIAKRLGNKNLARAVGNVLHQNSDPDGNPCYKVVNVCGFLSRSYAFGGIEEQKRRLQAEGIEVINNCVDLRKYGYKR
mgnify:CR=1 FL=1